MITEKDRIIMELRLTLKRMTADYEQVTKSETVRYYLQKTASGEYVHDITALDRGIKALRKRCQKAENSAQEHMAAAVYYRRKCEAVEIERKEEEENRFPLFCPHNGGNEDQHAKA